MIREGAKVSWVGDGIDGLVLGDTGVVVAEAGRGSHVRWVTGTLAGAITHVRDDETDLVVGTKTASSPLDAFANARMVSLAVRDTYDVEGPVGLLDALNEQGHLSTFASYAEEALEAVAGRITTDPAMREVLASLDPEEQAGFVSLAASTLLRDAFGGE